jgi:uncharacterized protein (TIGR00369 family)
MDDAANPDPRLALVVDRVARSAFHRWAGIELVRVEPGEVEVAMDATGDHVNLLGTVHGGVMAALADTAMGLALRTRLPEGTTQVTGQLDVHYVAPGLPGRLAGIGRVIKAGRQMGYAEADVLDARGTLLARASATLIVLRERHGRESRSGGASSAGAAGASRHRD